MSRKISIAEKRGWLQEYESGLSEYAIHKKYNKDIRTITEGIKAARQERNYNSAIVDMMKNVLSKHQGRLLERLHEYQSSIIIPKEDAMPLSWHKGENSIFSSELTSKPSDVIDDPIIAMLQQHLPKEKLWSLLKDWNTAQNESNSARTALQRKIFAILKKFGYPVVDSSSNVIPCIYIETVGPLFYRWAINTTLLSENTPDPDTEIVANADQPSIWYQRTILIESPQNPVVEKAALIKYYRKVSRSEEVQRVVETQRTLKIIAKSIQSAVNEILLLDFIPGECDTCRRLRQPN